MAEITRNALKLWALQLVPALFPFMIISNLFLKLSSRYIPDHKVINHICYRIFGLSLFGCYILLLGHICGYPLGAKMTADAYKDGQISIQEANYLLTICNQSSPAFLEFYVAAFALESLIPVPLLFLLFYLAAYITSLLTRRIYPGEKNKGGTSSNLFRNSAGNDNLFSLLDRSISESCHTILRVGGYVVIFSLISGFILSHVSDSNTNIIVALASSLEITNGLNLLKTYFFNFKYYPCLIIILTAFGGFCTMAQIKGMLVGTSLSIKPYIIGKTIYIAITAILLFLFFKIKIFDFCFQ